jgi:hypothetical protein
MAPTYSIIYRADRAAWGAGGYPSRDAALADLDDCRRVFGEGEALGIGRVDGGAVVADVTDEATS